MNEAVNENFYFDQSLLKLSQDPQNYLEPYVHCLLVGRIKLSQMSSREGLDAD